MFILNLGLVAICRYAFLSVCYCYTSAIIMIKLIYIYIYILTYNQHKAIVRSINKINNPLIDTTVYDYSVQVEN